MYPNFVLLSLKYDPCPSGMVLGNNTICALLEVCLKKITIA